MTLFTGLLTLALVGLLVPCVMVLALLAALGFGYSLARGLTWKRKRSAVHTPRPGVHAKLAPKARREALARGTRIAISPTAL